MSIFDLPCDRESRPQPGFTGHPDTRRAPSVYRNACTGVAVCGPPTEMAHRQRVQCQHRAIFVVATERKQRSDRFVSVYWLTSRPVDLGPQVHVSNAGAVDLVRSMR